MPYLLGLKDRLISMYKAHPRLSIGGGFVVVAALWFIFSGGSSSSDVLVVHNGALSQELKVSGTVTPAENVTLGFAESGRIASIYAKVGDQVRAGALLASIENGDERAAVLQKQAALEVEQSKLQSLQDGARPEDLAVAQSKVDSAKTSLDQANQALLDAMRDAYTAADDAVYNVSDQFFSNPRTPNPKLTFSLSNSQAGTTVESERYAMGDMLTTWQKKITSASVPTDALVLEVQGNLTATIQFLLDANTALGSGIPNGTVTSANLASYVSQVATARSSVNSARVALTSALTAQKSAAAALETSKRDLVLKQAGTSQSDINAQAAQVSVAQAGLLSAQAALSRTLVIAPFTGLVTRMDAKVGETISPSDEKIAMISNGIMQIESYVPEVDIAGLAVGNMATATLDAYGSEVAFPATIISIDPAETVRDGIATYKTKLQFLSKDERIRTGMSASVSIVFSEEQTAIAIPRGSVIERSGHYFVQVKEGKKIVEREVTLGQMYGGNVGILSGLYEGDAVVLSPQ